MILCNTKHFGAFLRLREKIFLFLTLEVYFPFCMAVYSGKGKAIALHEMAEMPGDSLGHQTSLFLRRYALSPMAGYEAHDMKHTLLGFPANMAGEICMQYFEYGNGNRSLPVLTVMLFGTLFMPEKIPEFFRQFQRGKRAAPLNSIDLKCYVKEPLNALQKRWKLS